jgi:undecaprenyl diphosphate synthase
MDGNGRWATARGLPRTEGHRMGVESVRCVVRACLEKKIPILSLFAFSSENWSRPSQEVGYLMQLFIESIESEIEMLHEQGVKFRFIGNRMHLSDLLQLTMQSVETLTQSNNALEMNIALNYGGRWDILQATRTLISRVQSNQLAVSDIDEALFSSVLDTKDLLDPDLLIRTSGELRISNFYLWQLAYSELYFSDVLWPDFRLAEFEQALTNYATRKRRFGNTSHQLKDAQYV